MNTWWIYSYHDYEEAYYHMQYYKYKEIGIYLLNRIPGKRSKELLRKLKKFEYDWLHPDTKGAQLLWDVKVWLMVNNW